MRNAKPAAKRIGHVATMLAIGSTLLACSGESTGGNTGGASPSVTLNGSVDGIEFHPVDATAVIGTGSFGGPESIYAVITVSDFPNLCAFENHSGPEKPNGTTFGFLLNNMNAPITPGTYNAFPLSQVQQGTPPTGPSVEAFIDQWDAQCNLKLQEPAADTGFVSLSEVSDSSVSGNFDVTFHGERLQGSFEVPICPVDINLIFHHNKLDAGLGTDGGLTCLP
jgi:hypothetical protein